MSLLAKAGPEDQYDLVYGKKKKQKHPLIKALESKKTGDTLEILANEAGLSYNKKFNILQDQGDRQILPCYLLEYYLFTDTRITCIHCMEHIDVNFLFLHLQHGFLNGTKYTHQQVTKFFKDQVDGTNDKIREEKNKSHSTR